MSRAQDFAARLTAREDCWPLLKGWAVAWCNSLQKSDGYLEAELDRAEDRLYLELPASLKELYCFAGHRLTKMNDPLIKPEELDVVQNLFLFWAENQYVVTWGIKLDDLASDDPPVFIDLNGCEPDIIGDFATPNRLTQQNETLSEFVFQMIVWDYMSWEMSRDQVLGEEEVANLLQAHRSLGFPDWTTEHFQKGRGGYTTPMKFYGNEPSLVVVRADKYARCVPRNRDQFLRHATQGR